MGGESLILCLKDQHGARVGDTTWSLTESEARRRADKKGTDKMEVDADDDDLALRHVEVKPGVEVEQYDAMLRSLSSRALSMYESLSLPVCMGLGYLNINHLDDWNASFSLLCIDLSSLLPFSSFLIMSGLPSQHSLDCSVGRDGLPSMPPSMPGTTLCISSHLPRRPPLPPHPQQHMCLHP